MFSLGLFGYGWAAETGALGLGGRRRGRLRVLRVLRVRQFFVGPSHALLPARRFRARRVSKHGNPYALQRTELRLPDLCPAAVRPLGLGSGQ